MPVLSGSHLPLVRTALTAELDRNQSLSLHAQLLNSGGLEIAEIGIEIGTRPSLSDGNLHPLRPMIGTVFTPPIWKIFLLGWNLFYRAYAINRLGFLTVRSARFNFSGCGPKYLVDSGIGSRWWLAYFGLVWHLPAYR